MPTCWVLATLRALAHVLLNTGQRKPWIAPGETAEQLLEGQLLPEDTRLVVVLSRASWQLEFPVLLNRVSVQDGPTRDVQSGIYTEHKPLRLRLGHVSSSPSPMGCSTAA